MHSSDQQQSLLDAFKILGCNQTHSVEDVKNQFRRLALVYHPDKGGDRQIFNNIVDSFKLVFRHKKAALDESPHHDLKSRSQSYMSQGTPTPGNSNGRRPSDPPSHHASGDALFTKDEADFQSKFNRFFDEHRNVDTNVARGYDDFIDAPEVKVSSNHYKIKKYEEPAGAVLCKSLAFHELGKKINDFSGQNDDMHKLQFMDYKYAHTTDKIIDPATVKERKGFKDMDDIRASRENEDFAVTDRDRVVLERSRDREARRERRRQANLEQYDQYLGEHQQRMNQMRIR